MNLAGAIFGFGLALLSLGGMLIVPGLPLAASSLRNADRLVPRLAVIAAVAIIVGATLIGATA